jgi:outer membrane protein assembly factor BamA
MTIAARTGSTTVLGLALVLLTLALRPTRCEPTGLVERIAIHGNTRTRDKVIRRELGIAEARMLVAGDLEHAKHRLEALGYFTSVKLSARTASPGRVTVDVTVSEQPGKSAGFSSVENFIAICAITQN